MTALAVLGLGFRALVWFAIFSVPLVLTIAIYPAGWAFALLAGVALVFIAAGMRAPRLDGERVDAAQVPELFTALEALRQRTRAPHVDEVRLT
ncbi:MAG TPA: hypothetical protein VLI89_07595, partial [Burkholderiales bacterium]|nr:hypothetical protein [Burkholderiales bacterium]